MLNCKYLSAVCIALLIQLITSCALANISQSENYNSGNNMIKLEEELISLDYEDLFLRLDYTNLEKLWNAPDMPSRLAELALNPEASNKARFLAAEILFHEQSDYPPQEAIEQLVSVYADALSNADIANPWGLPGELGDQAGKHFVQLGELAVPALIAMLDNKRPVLYSGSKEATVGNSYNYRVKDFAAFYISQIRHLPYVVHEQQQTRDAEIEKLRSSL